MQWVIYHALRGGGGWNLTFAIAMTKWNILSKAKIILSHLLEIN